MKHKESASHISLAAILGGLSLVTLYASVLVPTGRMGLVAVSGLFPAAAVVSGGPVVGGLCYAGTGILALLLLPDKGNALLYLLLFGVYPLVKYGAERLRVLPLELLLKLVFFNAMLSLLWFGLQTVFLSALPVEEMVLWQLYLIGNIVFLLYDFGFTKLITFYAVRIDAPLRKMRRQS